MKQYCTFYLNGMLFGVDVLEVQEVLLYQEMTQVPLAHDAIKGLINLRGQIVTAIDLRDRFSLSYSRSDEPPKNIVIQSEDGAVSLLVDEIGEVIEPDENLFEETPENIKGVAREMIQGVYKLDGNLLLILDTLKTISINSCQSSNWLQANETHTNL